MQGFSTKSLIGLMVPATIIQIGITTLVYQDGNPSLLLTVMLVVGCLVNLLIWLKILPLRSMYYWLYRYSLSGNRPLIAQEYLLTAQDLVDRHGSRAVDVATRELHASIDSDDRAESRKWSSVRLMIRSGTVKRT